MSEDLTARVEQLEHDLRELQKWKDKFLSREWDNSSKMNRNQRIYCGGTQYRSHSPGETHATPRLHDGYWEHFHDDGGMVAILCWRE